MRKIPEIKFPCIQNYNITKLDEELVPLTDYGILCDSQYYKNGTPGSYKICYARKSVAEKLKYAQNNLPEGIFIKVYDAYRPICIQQRLWNYYRQDIKNKTKLTDDNEIDFKTSFFISKPSYDIKNPSLHNTGGAVDVTLIDKDGVELNMGTKFDEFCNRTWTNHYEEYTNDEEIRNNRRILYWSMIDAGFTNLPSEWWHYDYGTKFWAYFNKTDALYEGIIDADFPNRFPLT